MKCPSIKNNTISLKKNIVTIKKHGKTLKLYSVNTTTRLKLNTGM